jgi:hypothetical protein
MPPKFGNYLFRNLKGQGPDPGPLAKRSETLGPLEEQIIVLKRTDIEAAEPGTPPLLWSKDPDQSVRVHLRDTEGMLEGRVTIKSTLLYAACPELFAAPPDKECPFLVSLKTVVLQIQSHLKKSQPDSMKPAGLEFDTPIAQVAREDEGFFKLEENAGHPDPAAEPPTPASLPNPPAEAALTSADPAVSLIREKPRPPDSPIRKTPAPLNISVGMPAPQEPPKIGDFQHLPKVNPKAGSSLTASEPGLINFAGPELWIESASGRPSSKISEPILLKPSRQAGLERLQEIFLTDNLLDGRQVARLVCDLPRVKAVLILLTDGTVIGGELPAGFSQETAPSVPALIRTVQQVAAQLSGAEAIGLTMLGSLPISLFAQGCVSLILVHEGRGLLPGMRERITDVLQALDILYDGLEIES